MKKNVMKIAISTAVATSAFVAVAPSQQVDAVVNMEQLMSDALNAGTVLKWAISIEGTADGVTQPWVQFNAAKASIAKVETAFKGISYTERVKYEARLADAKLQMQRAQAYLDAITASTKIQVKAAALTAAVNLNDIEAVERAYHEMTAEFRKQTILLDRVYGQSTRDKIRNVVKGPAERLIADLKNDVTVNMLTKAALEDIRLGKHTEANRKIYEAQAILNANVLKWESSLQQSLNKVTNTVPAQVSSVTRVDSTTVTVKFNRAVSSILASEFTFDNALSMTGVSLSKDGLTATLTTSVQTPSVKYTLKYKGNSASFTAPGNITTIKVEDSTTQHRETTEVLALSATFAGSYGYNTIKVDIPAGVKILSVNGIENVIIGARSINVNPDRNGTVTITFTAKDVNTASVDKTITFNEMAGNKIIDTKTSGLINFYAPAKAGTLTNKKVHYVDTYNNFFVTTDGQKYRLRGSSDNYRNEGIAVSFDSFKSSLDVDDTVSGTYQPTATSTFNITLNNYYIGLNIDSEFARKSGTAGYRMIGTDIDLVGTGQPNYEVFLFKNNKYVTKVKMNTTGTWKFKTTVTKNDLTDFTMIQQPAGKATPSINNDGAISLRVVEGPYNLDSVTVGKGKEEDLSSKTVTFNIAPIKRTNGSTAAQPDTPVIAKTAFITVQDGDGTQVKFTNGDKGTAFTPITSKGFNIKFGAKTADGKPAGEVLQLGTDDIEDKVTLAGPLDIIAIDGIANAYGFVLNLNSTFVIKGY